MRFCKERFLDFILNFEFIIGCLSFMAIFNYFIRIEKYGKERYGFVWGR